MLSDENGPGEQEWNIVGEEEKDVGEALNMAKLSLNLVMGLTTQRTIKLKKRTGQ